MPLTIPVQQEVARETLTPLFPKNWASHLLSGEMSDRKGKRSPEWQWLKDKEGEDEFSSVTELCPTLCDPMNCSTPGLPVLHQLPEFAQTHAHRVSDAIQPSHPLSSPSPAPNPSQHQGLFRRVNSSHQVAKVLEFQLQHQSFQ